MSDLKGFQNILTNVKTVIGLSLIIVALITFVLLQKEKIEDMEVAITNYKLVLNQRFEKVEKLLESIDRAVGWNRNYIMNMKMPTKTRAIEIE